MEPEGPAIQRISSGVSPLSSNTNSNGVLTNGLPWLAWASHDSMRRIQVNGCVRFNCKV
jgi:hypothetical protein